MPYRSAERRITASGPSRCLARVDWGVVIDSRQPGTLQRRAGTLSMGQGGTVAAAGEAALRVLGTDRVGFVTGRPLQRLTGRRPGLPGRPPGLGERLLYRERPGALLGSRLSSSCRRLRATPGTVGRTAPRWIRPSALSKEHGSRGTGTVSYRTMPRVRRHSGSESQGPDHLVVQRLHRL